MVILKVILSTITVWKLFISIPKLTRWSHRQRGKSADCSKARFVFDDVYTCCAGLSVLFVTTNLTIQIFGIEIVKTYQVTFFKTTYLNII